MLNQERVKEIENKPLHRGAGAGVDKACVMQMVSYIAGDKWTDKKNQTKRVLTASEWEIVLSLREYARCHPMARKKAA